MSVSLTRMERINSLDSGVWSTASTSSEILSAVDLEAGLGGNLFSNTNSFFATNSVSGLSASTHLPLSLGSGLDERPSRLPMRLALTDGFKKLTTGGRSQKYHVALLTTILPGVAMTDETTGLINRTLPKELILRILAYVDIVGKCRCASVCRLWNQLALDGSLWQSVDFFAFQRDIRTPVVESLARRCGGFLKKLSLYACENVQDRALRTFAEKCSGIEDLNLCKCKRLTDATCDALGSSCSRLRILNLDGCGAVTEAGLRSLSNGCPQLRHLNISWCEGILDPGLEAIAAGCPQLEVLHANGCTGLTDTGVVATGRGCPELRVLSLNSCPALTDDAIAAVGDGCPQLEALSVSMCPRLTDRALQALARGCQFLRDLEVAGCAQVTDAGVSALAKHCHDLERMDLEDCSLLTDAALGQLGTGCPRLVSLSLSHCELVTDEGVRQLSLGLLHQDRLKFLDLDNCPLVTDASLEHLREMRTLQKVDLYDCQAITRPGIRRFKQYLPEVSVHAYFAPVTPPANQPQRRSGFCRCCVIL